MKKLQDEYPNDFLAFCKNEQELEGLVINQVQQHPSAYEMAYNNWLFNYCFKDVIE